MIDLLFLGALAIDTEKPGQVKLINHLKMLFQDYNRRGTCEAYIAPLVPLYRIQTTVTLNVRAGPTIDAKVLRQVGKGEAFEVFAEESMPGVVWKWLQIGVGEWVSGKYAAKIA